MSNRKLEDLLRRQEEDRRALAAGVWDQWQPIGALERELLSPFGGNFDKAPDSIRQTIIQHRQAFFAEWGSEGQLAATMESRHAQERKEWAEKEAMVQEIKRGGRSEGNDGGR